MFTDGVMVLPENKGKGIGQLKTMGTLRGFTVWTYKDYIRSGQVKVAESDNFIPLLKQVLIKHIDGAYIELAVANYYLHEVLEKPGGLVFDPDLPHTNDYYYLSTINNPEVIQMFNEFQATEQEAIEQLKIKYKVGVHAQ